MVIGVGCEYYQAFPKMHQRNPDFVFGNGGKRDDIDSLIALQNERLRMVLQKQRSQQLQRLVKMVEAKTMFLLRQKEEDVVNARNKAVELEECLRRVAAENEAWQRLAREKEATAMALSNALEQVRKSAACCSSSNAADDAESCCQDSPPQQATPVGGWVCRACCASRSCVLMLPCQHLCSCKACEAFLDLCPVCKSAKEASIEVYMH